MSQPVHHLRTARPADLDRCFAIESTAYEGDEAATREKIQTRIATYPEGFLVLALEDHIVGFINAGCAHEVRMADEAFKELIGHDPAAPHVVVMSVVVDPAFQGQGWSVVLMQRFVAHMRGLCKHSIHLMCRTRHIGLYEKMGFVYVKPSESDHGGMAWHDMVMRLNASTTNA